jgi:hypothetical protein
MNGMQKATRLIQGLTPWASAAAASGAVGASVSSPEDRKKGFMKGALIGLGGIASGKIGKVLTEKIIKNKFGMKYQDVKHAVSLGDPKKSKEFLKSRGYKKEDVDSLYKLFSTGTLVENFLPMGIAAAGTAGTAYALKNGNNSKK